MPIYAYRCEACGFAKDVLQKYSDPQLTVCLSCGAPAFKKQVTAAGFQLKGTGWYATDFRNGAGASVPPVNGGEGGDAKNADAGKGGKDGAPAGNGAANGAGSGSGSGSASNAGASTDKAGANAAGASAGAATAPAGKSSASAAGGGTPSSGS